jgi:hypothetical protein
MKIEYTGGGKAGVRNGKVSVKLGGVTFPEGEGGGG